MDIKWPRFIHLQSDSEMIHPINWKATYCKRFVKFCVLLGDLLDEMRLFDANWNRKFSFTPVSISFLP